MFVYVPAKTGTGNRCHIDRFLVPIPVGRHLKPAPKTGQCVTGFIYHRLACTVGTRTRETLNHKSHTTSRFVAVLLVIARPPTSANPFSACHIPLVIIIIIIYMFCNIARRQRRLTSAEITSRAARRPLYPGHDTVPGRLLTVPLNLMFNVIILLTARLLQLVLSRHI